MTPVPHTSGFRFGFAHFTGLLAACALLAATGCGDGGAVTPDDLPIDGDASLGMLLDGGLPLDGDASLVTGQDSGTVTGYDSSVPSLFDSSVPPVADSGTADSATASDAAVAADASAAEDGGVPGLDDLFPPMPTPDASTPPPSTGDGSVDKSAPCADLELFCIDPFDMFVFNPELCFTCNGGKGCQGCAFPYAY